MTAHPETLLRPRSIDEVAAAVRDLPRLQVVGAATKSALTAPQNDVARCELTQLTGVVEHQPSEFLITALAGTPLADLDRTLAQHGQYFPFDPPLVAAGATIGGTLACGLSGPGRLRYGGIRDFVMGVRLVDGLGKVVTGGGRVVKNAAGYDLPKLMVGSGGMLGAIVELTLKVFPRPATELSLRVTTTDFAAAVKLQFALARSPIELTALDLLPEPALLVRLSGEPAAVQGAADRVKTLIASHDRQAVVESAEDAAALWQPLLDGSWLAAGDRWVRVPLPPGELLQLEASLAQTLVARRYSVAGNLAWIRWPAERPLSQLDELLRFHRLGGTVLLGAASQCRLGTRGDAEMLRRIKSALDPHDKFVGCP